MSDFDFTIGEVLADNDSLIKEMPCTSNIERLLVLLVSEIRWIREGQECGK